MKRKSCTGAIRTCAEVGKIIGISASGVHKIETRAFKKLRHRLCDDPDLRELLIQLGIVPIPD